MKMTHLQRIKTLEKYCDNNNILLTSGRPVRFDQIILGEVTLNESANKLINELLDSLKQWDIKEIYHDQKLSYAWVNLKNSDYKSRVDAVKARAIAEKHERENRERLAAKKALADKHERELRERLAAEKALADKHERELRERLAAERARHEETIRIYEDEVRAWLKENPLEAEKKLRGHSYKDHIDFSSLTLEWAKNADTDKHRYGHLSQEQFKAVADISLNTLLRARAGSGKTTVIKNKIDFMLRHAGLLPEDIMVLAFNSNAAEKVKRDIQNEFNHIAFQNSRTFHSLAYKIVKPTEDLLFDEKTGSNAKQSQFVESLLKDEINPAIKENIYKFFRQEMKEVESLGGLLSKDDYYVLRRNSTQDTLKGEVVKSKGEKWIADFLFEHGIRYVYERSWYRDKSGMQGNYYPDFSLAIAGKLPDVVIEHWGIDEFDPQQKVPEHWSQSWQDYRRDMDIKRQYWNRWNTDNAGRQVVFLETSIRDTRYGRESFERVLKERFASINVSVQRRPSDQLVEEVVRRHTPKLAKMCLQFINRAKKSCLSPDDVDKKIASYDFLCAKERVFVLLANRMYHRYQYEVKAQNKIDFDDLLKRAVEIVNEQKGNIHLPLGRDGGVSLNQIKWLMIDEYQDFSRLFFNLVKVIRQYNPEVRLFCVGDNWQAINGFAGSDLKYFNDFDQYFDNATLLDLCNNYRSQQNIVLQGNRFMANSDGAPSIPKAKLEYQPIYKYLTNEVFVEQRSNVSRADNPDAPFLSFVKSRDEETQIDVGGVMAKQFKLCKLLMQNHDLAKTTFMILARSNYQAYGYETMEKFKRKLKSCFMGDLNRFRSFDDQVKCITAHRSKGAEADVVIILNVKEKRFPIIHPDNQLYGVLGATLEEVYQEEERLFYVAITRAKQALYILTEKDLESEFLDRIYTIQYKFSTKPGAA